MRPFIRSIIFSALTLAPGFAAAAGPVPSDASFAQAKTVGVLPVLTTGSRSAAYARFAAFVEQGSHTNGLVNGTDFVKLGESGHGFGFAGQSSSTDLAVFQYGFLLGSIPNSAEDPAALAKLVASLEGARELLAPLGEDVVTAVDTFLAKAKQGEMDASSLSRAVRAAEDGIARGPARANGYFAAGTWLGLTLIAVNLGAPDETFNAMALPLAEMLEEDAAFGGSDRKIAAVMRKVQSMLATGRVDMTAYKASLGELTTIEADVQ